MSDANPNRSVPNVRIIHPEWSRNATIYQINTRQFTDEGTFKAAKFHLSRVAGAGCGHSVVDAGAGHR